MGQSGNIGRLAAGVGLIAAATFAMPPSAEATFPGRPGNIAWTESTYVKVMNPATGRARRFAHGPNGVSPLGFTPDGRRLAYIRWNGFVNLPGNPGAGVARQVIFVKSTRNRSVRDPGRRVFFRRNWLILSVTAAPGDRLVFSARRAFGRGRDRDAEIYSIRTDGSGLRRLTGNRSDDLDPDVSPNGRRVAFVRRVRGRGQIYTMSIRGGSERRVTRGRDRNRAPSWSPSGRRIAYFSRMRSSGDSPWDSEEIFTIRPSGEGKGRLTHNKRSDGYPAFSPNGRRIVFVRQCGCARETDLWVMRADGSGQRLLHRGTDPSGMHAPRWGVRAGR